MVLLQAGGIPEHHDGIADELIDSPAFGDECLRQGSKMARGLAHQNVGIGCFSDAR